MPGRGDLEANLDSTTAGPPVASPNAEAGQRSNGQRLLAKEYLDPDKPYPNVIDKVLTFRRLRRYDLIRIEYDLLELYYALKTAPNGGTETQRTSLTALLHDHSMVSLLLKRLLFWLRRH